MAKKTKTASKTNSKKTATTHIVMTGKGAALCGAKGKMAEADAATCEECKKIAAHAEEKRAARVKAEETKAAEGATKDASARLRDPRLPPAGTVLQKKDRQGNVRCECTVEADGIVYKGATFRSLSAAPMAASKDLGLGGGANGYLFWQIIRQAPREKDPVAALEHAWERHRARAEGILKTGVNDENRAKVLSMVKKHVDALEALRETAA